MENFKDMKVWVKSHELTLAISAHTRGFPKEEIYGLTSKYGVRRHPSGRTLPKDVADRLTAK